MITNIQVGMGNLLGAQMSDVASLYYIARETNQKLVFFDEFSSFRRGYQFYKVFNMDGIELIRSTSLLNNLISPFLKDKASISWEKEMHKIYHSKFHRYKDLFLYKLFALNDGFSLVYDCKNGIHTDSKLLHLDINSNYDIRNGYGTIQDYNKYLDDIVKIFSFKDEVVEESCKNNQSLLNILNNEDTVSIHFRRTDYLVVSSLNLTMDYYRKAMTYFDTTSKFIVFSDDIEWAKTTDILKDKDCFFVEGNGGGADMYLMSLCKNNIIANSSFSFWASILNKNKQKKVVCPYNYVGFESYLNGNYYPNNYIAI